MGRLLSALLFLKGLSPQLFKQLPQTLQQELQGLPFDRFVKEGSRRSATVKVLEVILKNSKQERVLSYLEGIQHFVSEHVSQILLSEFYIDKLKKKD